MRSIIRRKPLQAAACAIAAAATATIPSVAAAEPPAPVTPEARENAFTIQATCPASFTPRIYDWLGNETARAYWNVWCSGGNVYMTGWVDDKQSDGNCAVVRGENPHTRPQFARNCPADSPRTNFEFKAPGNSINGYLYLD